MAPSTPPPATREPALPLVQRLAGALEREGIVCCQWKGHFKRHRLESGDGDLDLLVDDTSLSPFSQVLGELGFRTAVWPAPWQVPGVESHLGYDPQLGRIIHVHTYYRLVIGSPWRTMYRLPLERSCLKGATKGGLFPIPQPEHELIVFLLRMVQRFSIREPFRREPRFVAQAQAELKYLTERTDGQRLAATLVRDLPSVNLRFLEQCTSALRPGSSKWGRVRTRRGLHRRLASYARRPPAGAVLSALTSHASDKRPRVGGLTVALNGGDGAGKTTCTRELAAWLEPHLGVFHAHLGRPPRSALTLLVGAGLKIASRLGRGLHFELLRHTATARDRYRLSRKVQRFTARGGIALCERYPIPEAWPLCGPSIAQGVAPSLHTPLARLLRRWEERYYRAMGRPDVSLVLRLPPELAVRRKPTEPANYVRARGAIIWETDWQRAGVRVVDAARPLPEVMSDLKNLVWRAL